MARQGKLVLRDVDYCALFALTSDTSAGYTSGLGYEVPGIQKIELKPELLNDELYGSARILDIYSRAKKIMGTIDHAILSLDILEHLTGGSSLQTGTSPNEIREFIWSTDDQMPYFALACQCKYQGGELSGGIGDSLFWLWKCKMKTFTLGMKMDGYCIGTFEFEAIPPNYIDPTAGKRKIFSVFERQATAPLTLTVDTTPPTLSSVTLATPGGSTFANGAAVTRNASTTICFNYSEPLHQSWITNMFSLTISDGTAVPVTGVLVGTSTISVTVNLGTVGAYILSDSTQIRDLAGNQLAARTVRTFTVS